MNIMTIDLSKNKQPDLNIWLYTYYDIYFCQPDPEISGREGITKALFYKLFYLFHTAGLYYNTIDSDQI